MFRALLVAVILFGGVIIYLRHLEYSNIFRPYGELGADPSDAGMPYEDIYFPSSGSVVLNGWFIPSDRPASKTLLFCHGNAGNLSDRIEQIKLFRDLGLNVFVFDYRGYGRSTGYPTEEGLYQDAIAAHEYLIKEKDMSPEDIIVYGRSLGAAVAIELSLRQRSGVLIVDSTFKSIKDMARIVYPLIPADILLSMKFDNMEKVADLRVPKLFIHSREDEMIPYEQGEDLFRAAAVPKEFFVSRGDHNNGMIENSEYYSAGIAVFIDKYSMGGSGTAL